LGASACVLHAVALIRTVVQRLFSTFAGGLPGVGLLILRVAVAVPLLSAGLKTAASASPVTLELAAAGAALFLLAGLWTPLAGAVIAAAELALAVSHPAERGTFLQFSALSTALALLGPGGCSLDARLFGRKHIRIPKR
jgi:putative oxidoreductase